MYSERVYELVNRFMRFLPFFRGFYGFSRFSNFHDPQIKKQKIENFRFSQNRFKIYLDGQYGYKTCLGHQGTHLVPYIIILGHQAKFWRNSIFAPNAILGKFLKFWFVGQISIFLHKVLENTIWCFQNLLWVPNPFPNTMDVIIWWFERNLKNHKNHQFLWFSPLELQKGKSPKIDDFYDLLDFVQIII